MWMLVHKLVHVLEDFNLAVILYICQVKFSASISCHVEVAMVTAAASWHTLLEMTDKMTCEVVACFSVLFWAAIPQIPFFLSDYTVGYTNSSGLVPYACSSYVSYIYDCSFSSVDSCPPLVAYCRKTWQLIELPVCTASLPVTYMYLLDRDFPTVFDTFCLNVQSFYVYFGNGTEKSLPSNSDLLKTHSACLKVVKYPDSVIAVVNS